MHIAIKDLDHGTRKAGTCLQQQVCNKIDEGANLIIFDFSDVEIVSSGWADAAIGKLLQQRGIVSVLERLRFINVNITVQTILDRVIVQRLSKS